MANMGYVRFENTYRDLQDCNSHLFDELSMSEHNYRARLVKLCRKIVAEAEGEDDFLLTEAKEDEEGE